MGNPAAILQKAIDLHKAGKLTEGEIQYRNYLTLVPTDANAYYFLGLLLAGRGNDAEAEKQFARAISLSPPKAELFLARAKVQRNSRKLKEATGDLKKALTLQPNLAEAHHELGNILKQEHRYPEAILELRSAVKIKPDDPTFHLNLGVALLESGDARDAISAFRTALDLAPERADAHNILGTALLAANQTSEAEAELRAALRLAPNYAAAHDNLGRCLRNQGLAKEAKIEFELALASKALPSTYSNYLYSLNFVPGLNPSEIFARHRDWARTFTGDAAPLAIRTRPGRIRIGYVSADFCHHAVAYFFEPVLLFHDRKIFEVFCYSNVSKPDQVTGEFMKLSDQWRDISGLRDDEAAAMILKDEIDILVDLSGHTAGNRLLLFARRCAPIQLTWLGYPNTTGLDAIDFRITDAITDPPGQTDQFYSEKLLRLPDHFSCYQHPAESPPVALPPSQKNRYITLGSFCHLSKINDQVIRLWADVLKRIEG